MISNKWKAANKWIQHGVLASISLSFALWVQLEVLPWQKVTFLVLSILLISAVSYYAHKRYVNIMVKVVRMDYGELAWLVQRELKTLYVPFIKKSRDEEVVLEIRSKGIAVKIESFLLNMPIDDHIKPVPAAKITVTPIRKEWDFVNKFCAAIDNALLNNPQIAFASAGD